MMSAYTKMLDALGKYSTVGIAFHKSPDGDALGSSLALAWALEGQGKTVDLYSYDQVPQVYRFLPGWEKIRVVKKEEIHHHPPLFFILDSSDLKRVPFFERLPQIEVVINIDHHETNEYFGDINLVEPSASSTGELIYRLLLRIGILLNPCISLCLYTAIFTDTGGFRYPNTTAEALKCGYHLIEAGADPYLVATEVYESFTPQRLRLLGKVLDTLKMGAEGTLAWAIVTRGMMEETNTGPEDTEEFVSNLCSIKGVEAALLFREKLSGGVKVSLRSRGRVNVAEVASRLGGGGHRNAAGCDLKGDLDAAISIIVPFMERELLCSISSTGY